MSDDKDPKNPPKGDGTGPDAGNTGTSTTIGFGELFGHIDSRIEAILGKKSGSSTNGAKTGTSGAGEADPQSVREQLRAELAKLQGEDAAKKKEADRDVTIQELKDTVTKLTEVRPEENVSKLTSFMWGKKKKS